MEIEEIVGISEPFVLDENDLSALGKYWAETQPKQGNFLSRNLGFILLWVVGAVFVFAPRFDWLTEHASTVFMTFLATVGGFIAYAYVQGWLEQWGSKVPTKRNR